ncbi:uncharacterized protein HaLaN_04289 [Haematococcus lacustris]|uniref:C3H1-type domain-containing protein n=1 Tax=Haematococcus lacustris TaxID=44745 RepID=A0A699YSC1_HAELA|nr:uncharacterized protein HaLaN_04289 [Haematococcus lacustris]
MLGPPDFVAMPMFDQKNDDKHWGDECLTLLCSFAPDNVQQLCALSKKLGVKILNEYYKAVEMYVPPGTLRADLQHMCIAVYRSGELCILCCGCCEAALDRPIAQNGTVRVPAARASRRKRDAEIRRFALLPRCTLAVFAFCTCLALYPPCSCYARLGRDVESKGPALPTSAGFVLRGSGASVEQQGIITVSHLPRNGNVHLLGGLVARLRLSQWGSAPARQSIRPTASSGTGPACLSTISAGPLAREEPSKSVGFRRCTRYISIVCLSLTHGRPLSCVQTCTFFVRTGTCAYGDRCKFLHPTDCPPPQLNSAGYPIRTTDPICAHYLKKVPAQLLQWMVFPAACCNINHVLHLPPWRVLPALAGLVCFWHHMQVPSHSHASAAAGDAYARLGNPADAAFP